MTRTASSPTLIVGVLSGGLHTAVANQAPFLSSRAMVRAAASRSGTNISPHRHRAASKSRSSSVSDFASASTNLRLLNPSEAVRSRVRSSIAGD